MVTNKDIIEEDYDDEGITLEYYMEHGGPCTCRECYGTMIFNEKDYTFECNKCGEVADAWLYEITFCEVDDHDYDEYY